MANNDISLSTKPAQVASSFLSVPELAALLHVNEKKIYQLAGSGEIPGTKITGKWIFPRSLIEDWLLENSHGGVMQDRLLLAGSDDRLIQHVCSNAAIDWQENALVSYSPAGTRHGLRMLDSNRVDACFINWGAVEDTARRHLGLLRCYRRHASWVIVRCLQRSQGFIVSKKLSDTLDMSTENLAAALIKRTELGWAMRQDDSGTERLLEDLCSVQGQRVANLKVSTECNSERSAVAAVNTGAADITCGVQSTAHEFGLHYLPIADVALDLVMSQKTYFRTLVQDLLERIQVLETDKLPIRLDGYQINSKLNLVTLD